MVVVPVDAQGFSHVPVMPREVVAAFASHGQGVLLDVTAGGGNHAALLLEQAPALRLYAFDRDPVAVRATRAKLAPFGARATVTQASFAELPETLAALGVTAVDGVLADLGVSSQQLTDAERGLSFRLEGPLDMRMDPTRGPTARQLCEELSRDELADLIFQLGEERASRRIARCIKQALEVGELTTTSELRRAVIRAVGPRRVGGVDPSTRTFQALRIAVNRELEQLQGLLEMLPGWLRPGGTAALISFHSLEDRLVKHAFQQRQVWERVTRKPLVAGEAELAANPRARSAKLRVAQRAEEGEP